MCSMLMTVGTHHITLLNLFHGFLQTIFLEDPVDIVQLFFVRSVIKLKHVVGVAIATISTALIFLILTNFG